MKIDVKELNRIIVTSKETEDSIRRIIRSNKIRKIARRRRIISFFSCILGIGGFLIMVSAAGSSDMDMISLSQSIVLSLIGIVSFGLGVLLHNLLKSTE